MFEVFLDIHAQAFLKEAGESMHSRVRETLEELALDPVPQGAKRIINDLCKYTIDALCKYTIVYVS